jgi:ankyrin repeat protein
MAGRGMRGLQSTQVSSCSLSSPFTQKTLLPSIVTSTMAFLRLPNEIIIQIIEYLHDQRDINSVTRVNRRFHNLFDDYLFGYNIKLRGGSALLWAAEHGRESTALKLLHLGADVDVKLQKQSARPGQLKPSSSDNTNAHFGVTPLHMAAWKGHLAIVEILLEIGANPEARMPHSWTPLYVALMSGHEKIARTISRRISNAHVCLVDSRKQLTPLHVASRYKLSNSVRYFLDEGADVNARDTRARTPLHCALASDHYLFDLGHNPIIHKFNNYATEHNPDEVFKTVMVLLNFGADPDLETTREPMWNPPITGRALGACHGDERVRALFESSASVSSPSSVSTQKPDTLQIGRSWMLPCSSVVNRREGDEPRPGFCVDDERFYRNQSTFESSRLRKVKPDTSSSSD